MALIGRDPNTGQPPSSFPASSSVNRTIIVVPGASGGLLSDLTTLSVPLLAHCFCSSYRMTSPHQVPPRLNMDCPEYMWGPPWTLYSAQDGVYHSAENTLLLLSSLSMQPLRVLCLGIVKYFQFRYEVQHIGMHRAVPSKTPQD
ncbi:hypothetical protein CIHG_00362 [Coccidioides immitis H538.4]|uniref:Uncharacterized protein n=1 Tax=Coccidioides immitis H538.4 TaxID=396776 RepID=A0A0J8RDG1_COCIT|nr:hypothetical protein CIHG_00362 [Coccidioides immitis H538.4]